MRRTALTIVRKSLIVVEVLFAAYPVWKVGREYGLWGGPDRETLADCQPALLALDGSSPDALERSTAFLEASIPDEQEETRFGMAMSFFTVLLEVLIKRALHLHSPAFP